jgi:hypothetical protein
MDLSCRTTVFPWRNPGDTLNTIRETMILDIPDTWLTEGKPKRFRDALYSRGSSKNYE